MITLCLGLVGLTLLLFRVEAAEMLALVAATIIRHRNSWLDRSLPARRQPGYRLALR